MYVNTEHVKSNGQLFVGDYQDPGPDAKGIAIEHVRTLSAYRCLRRLSVAIDGA